MHPVSYVLRRPRHALRRLLVLTSAVLLVVVPTAWTAASAAGVTFTVQPASPGRTLSPSWSFSVTGPGSPSCTLTPPSGTPDASVACGSGTFTASLAGRPDGTYTLRVSVGASSATSTYVLDTVAPPAPTVTGPNGPSRQMTGTFTLADAEPGVTWLCRESTPSGTFYPSCSAGSWSVMFSSEGTYTGYISVRDAAGNLSPETVHPYTVDLTAPTAPTVTLVPGSHPPRTPTYQLAGEAGGTWTCTLTAPGGGSSDVPCTAGQLPLDLQGSDGAWSLAVRQTDAAGNVGALSTAHYLLDTLAPIAPGLSGPAGPSRDRTPTYTLTGEAGASYVCDLTKPSGTASIACGAGTLALNLTDPVANVDGDYTVTAHQVDASGNVGPVAFVTYQLDSLTAAPTVNGPTGPSNVAHPVFTFESAEAGTYSCTVTSPTGVVSTPDCSAGQLTLDASPAGEDGGWQLSVEHVDVASNAGTTTVTYVLDKTPPAAPAVDGPFGPHVPRKPGYALSGEEGATYTCLLNGPSITNVPIPCAAGLLVLDLTGTDGTYSLAVTQTGAAGNTSPPTTVSYDLDTQAPDAPTVTGPTGPSTDPGPASASPASPAAVGPAP